MSTQRFDLTGKLAVITGGASGIGLATSQALVEAGAKVVIFSRNANQLAEAERALGPNVSTVQGDVTRIEDLERLYASVAQHHGKIDVLIANAGLGRFAPAEAVDEAHFDLISEVNYKGAYFTVAKAIPHLNDGASVIFTTSVVNVTGLPGATVYSATKAAVRSMARTFAAELAPRGVRVNAVSPGPVQTPFFDKVEMTEEQLEGFAAGVGGRVALGRFGRPEEIAGPMVFLASDAASFVTGAEIQADGGFAQL
ncbi:MAG: SDR family oxidoreductase [Pseudomonadota bacterium]